MSERITGAMITSSTLADIGTSLLAMERSEGELSSGKAIAQPSDNPYGAGRAIELQSTLDGLTSYEHNVKDGTSWLQTTSSAMSNIDDAVQRVRELLVQASNGVNNQTDLNNIAEEVDQLTESVKQDANTQYAGQYVFAGTLTSTKPYPPGANDEYQGNTGTITRAIGPSATVTVNTNLSTVLGNGAGSGDGKLLDVLRTISQNLRGGTPEAVQALGTTDLTNLDSNLDALTTVQAGAGAVSDQLSMAGSRIEDFQTNTAETLSSVEDADIAQTAIKYSNQQAAYNAALHAGANIVQMSLLDFLH